MPSTISTSESFRRAALRIRKCANLMAGVARGGLRLIGEEIMTDVKASRPGAGVPRDTGALASTGEVTQPEPEVVELSFGGVAAEGGKDVGYALIQHENLEFHHALGEARYLVRGLERWKPDGSAAVKAIEENADAAVKAASK